MFNVCATTRGFSNVSAHQSDSEVTSMHPARIGHYTPRTTRNLILPICLTLSTSADKTLLESFDAKAPMTSMLQKFEFFKDSTYMMH